MSSLALGRLLKTIKDWEDCHAKALERVQHNEMLVNEMREALRSKDRQIHEQGRQIQQQGDQIQQQGDQIQQQGQQVQQLVAALLQRCGMRTTMWERIWHI